VKNAKDAEAAKDAKFMTRSQQLGLFILLIAFAIYIVVRVG